MNDELLDLLVHGIETECPKQRRSNMVRLLALLDERYERKVEETKQKLATSQEELKPKVLQAMETKCWCMAEYIEDGQVKVIKGRVHEFSDDHFRIIESELRSARINFDDLLQFRIETDTTEWKDDD